MNYIALILIVTLSFIWLPRQEESEAKEVSKLQKVQNTMEWTNETNKKYKKLVEIGMPKEIAKSLINNCKATARDPAHCVSIGASILWAESSLGTKCHNNNCVGMNDGAVGYKTKNDGIKAWVAKYNKWWYKQPNPSWFYRADGIPPTTRYCMGKRRDGVCKEGTKNSWAVFNKLNQS